MHSRFVALALCLAVAPGLACDKSSETTVEPASIDELTLYDSYGELMVAVLTGMRTGDLSVVRNSIATDAHAEAMCSDYRAFSGGPYTPPTIVEASDHCKEVFGPIPQATLDEAIATHPYGISHQPQKDTGFETHWRERCPADFQVYQMTEIFEARGEGLPSAGFEVDQVFSYQGRFGLLSIPRCRGEGE